jgi:alkylhydroperoxidase family enzyme
LRELSRFEISGSFSDHERLVIEYAVEMTKTPMHVPDALFSRLQAEFDGPQLVELTASIAWENYRARFNHAFGLEAQGFSEGAFCALPGR